MINAINPLDSLLGGYGELQQPVKTEIAVKVLCYVSGFKAGVTYSERTIEKFETWLKRGSNDPHKMAGKVLFAKALIDFEPFKYKGSTEGWDEIRQLTVSISSELDEGLLKEILDDKTRAGLEHVLSTIKDRASFDQRQWMKAAES